MLIWEDIEIPKSDVFALYQVIRRSGAVVSFELERSVAAFVCEVVAVGRLMNAIVALDELRSYSRQRLGIVNLKQKSNGFFSASKANLRNAP